MFVEIGILCTHLLYLWVYVCVHVCLTKRFDSATLYDTELTVAAGQLLLSYRDTQSYNNRSGAQRD